MAFALIPLGRPAAWVCLFALSAGLGWLVNRAAGTIAAVTAILLYLWVHGRPRFASTITDPWTIRFAFLLGLAGAAAAAVADWRRHQPESREEPKPGC